MLLVTYQLIALMLYTVAGIYLFCKLVKQLPWHKPSLVILIGGAIMFQGLALYKGIITTTGINLSIYNAQGLILFSVNSLVFISSLRKPLHSLFILLFPLSIISIAISMLLMPTDNTYHASTFNHLTMGVGLHIVLSIIAYSLLFAAVLQALLLNWQNNCLKSKHIPIIMKYLPPLQTMETLLFELLWAGMILLTLGMIAGVLYIDNIFAQHLVHKTALSAIAWLIFAILLWGRGRLGWRGAYAIRWVLGGFCALMLAYFGSKLVLEVILI